MQNSEIPTTTTPQAPPRTGRIARIFFEIGQYILLGLVFYMVGDALIGRARVGKQSMEPTFVPGDVLVVNRLTYRFSQPKRGEVITFHYPLDTSVDYIKRVIGLPGDHIEINDGKVTVNAIVVDEPYVVFSSADDGVWDVPQDSLFVMGDNRAVSADSRSWGFVPFKDLIGKVIAQYWPITRIGFIRTPNAFSGID